MQVEYILGGGVNAFKPIPVIEVGNWAQAIVAGGLHVLILSNDGFVQSFGNNEKGQIGLDTTTYYIPTEIPLH